MSGCRLFGLPIANVPLAEANAALVDDAAHARRRLVFFVNAHCVNLAARDRDYVRALHAADLIYADGAGMAIAARLAGEPLVDNVNGTDLFPVLCARAADAGVPIALLGARPGIAQRCADNMRARFPALRVAWVRDGYFEPGEERSLIAGLNASGAGIVLVAFGVPRQEAWLARHAGEMRAPVLLGVGGLFDFYSGLRSRAPWLLRKTGLEWAWRLALEPRRLFRRYVFGNPLFLARLCWLRLRGAERVRAGGRAFACEPAPSPADQPEAAGPP